MKRILFVCHGNICRSPMAEFVMKKMVANAGIADQFEIASAAPPARRKLAEHGISCDGKIARQITRRDYEHYDYIVAMDINNLRNLQRMLGEDKLHKISLLLNYTDHPRDVADPWYTGNFEATWQDVNDGCKGLLEYIKTT